MYKIILSIFIVLFVTGCASDSSDNSVPLEFKPTKIMDISHDAKLIDVLAIYGDIYVSGVRDVGLTFGKLTPEGNHEESFILVEDNVSDRFGDLVSLNDKYVVVGERSPNDINLYRLENNITLTKLQTITVESENLGRTVAGGMLLDGDTIAVSELRDSYDEESGQFIYDNKVVVYKIESDESVTRLQEIRSDRNTTLDESNFAAALAMDGGKLAISEGCYIDIFSKGETGTYSKTDSFLVDESLSENDCYFTLQMKDNHLAAYTRRYRDLYLLQLEENKILTSQKIEYDSSIESLTGTFAFIDDAMFVGFSQRLDISKMSDTNESVKLEKVKDINISTDILVAGDKYFLLTDTRAAEKFFVYDTYPLNKIFVYSDITTQNLDEKEIYSFYNVDAGSPVGSLTYTLSGNDATYFEINGTTLYNRVAFDYDNPQDVNQNNIYEINIDIVDADLNTKSIALSVNVLNRDYLLETRKVADDSSESKGLGSSVAIDGNKVLVGANASVYLFDAESLLHQLLKIVPESENVDKSFGQSVAISGDAILVGSPYEDINDTNQGAAYLFKVDANNTIISQNKIEMPTLDPQILFGDDVAMDETTIVIGAPGYYYSYRDSGKVFIYRYDSSMTPTLVQTIVSNEPQELDKFGKVLALGTDYLVIGAPNYPAEGLAYVGAMYVYKRDGSSFSYVTKITADVVAGSSYFGSKVAISGNYIAESSTFMNQVYIFKMDAEERGEKIALIEGVSGAVSIRGKDIFVVSSVEREVILYHYIITDSDSVELKESIQNHTSQSILSSYYDAIAQGDGFCVSGAQDASIDTTNSGNISLFRKEKK